MGRGPGAGGRARHRVRLLQRRARRRRLLASLLFGLIWTRMSPQAAFLTGAALALARNPAAYTSCFPMKRILVTNDDGVTRRASTRWPRRSAHLGTVIVVAPHIEASAIGHALTLRRPLRMERLRDGVYEVDGTPTDCVNVAITQLFDGAAGACRLGHQQGLQPWRRRDVFGDRGGSDGRGAARASRASPCRSSARAATYDFGPAAEAPRRSPSSCSRAACRRARSSTSTSRPARRRLRASRFKPVATTSPSSTERDRPARHAYYWIEEGQNDWEPHDRSDYQAVKDGFISVRHCSRT